MDPRKVCRPVLSPMTENARPFSQEQRNKLRWEARGRTQSQSPAREPSPGEGGATRPSRREHTAGHDFGSHHTYPKEGISGKKRVAGPRACPTFSRRGLESRGEGRTGGRVRRREGAQAPLCVPRGCLRWFLRSWFAVGRAGRGRTSGTWRSRFSDGTCERGRRVCI